MPTVTMVCQLRNVLYWAVGGSMAKAVHTGDGEGESSSARGESLQKRGGPVFVAGRVLDPRPPSPRAFTWT